MDYSDFRTKHPLLARRLHTLQCESCAATGIGQRFTYDGTETDGSGVIYTKLFYGHTKEKFTVTDGVINAFGLTQDMREPTRMSLSDGSYSDYGETDDRLLAI